LFELFDARIALGERLAQLVVSLAEGVEYGF
jgi:hypothetical protein